MRIAFGIVPIITISLCTATFICAPAGAQISAESWWPKFQRDAQNTGRVPVIGISTDAHVVAYVQLSPPIATENHATPVFSRDNSRVYVGGAASRLSAVDLESFSLAWQLTLGDGTGNIYHTAVVADDGSIYVGAWDNQAPYDGFAKVRDDGDHASVVWSVPMRRMLASPTIADNGLIIIGGRHDTLGYGYFGLRDLGDSYELAWSAALRSDPANPASTGNVGSSPAISLDGQYLYGGSDQNRTFWKIALADGAEFARVPLTQYCWAGAPLVTPDGYALIGEGMSFSAPNNDTEGKLYAMRPEAGGTDGVFASLALHGGHLNGGAATLAYRQNGAARRLFVTANGYGLSNAALVAVDFEPTGPSQDPPVDALREVWRISLGPSALCYPTCVTTRDAAIYAIGPADHNLYASRDAGASGRSLWSLALTQISRVSGWTIVNQRGPQSPIVTPQSRLLWNAPDGYLYEIAGWSTGDINGDEVVDETDVQLLQDAVTDRTAFELLFPEIPLDGVADIDGSGVIDAEDVTALQALIAP